MVYGISMCLLTSWLSLTLNLKYNLKTTVFIKQNLSAVLNKLYLFSSFSLFMLCTIFDHRHMVWTDTFNAKRSNQSRSWEMLETLASLSFITNSDDDSPTYHCVIYLKEWIYVCLIFRRNHSRYFMFDKVDLRYMLHF